MNISHLKIGAFFLGIMVLAWLLYPQRLFLGLIYEGTGELDKAQEHYERYLAKDPENKFARLHLADVYTRMAQPQKGIEILVKLYHERPKDWEVAKILLEKLEDNFEEELFLRFSKEVADHFQESHGIRRHRVRQLLEAAVEQALWDQKQEKAQELLLQLIALEGPRTEYLETLWVLDRSLKRLDRVIASLHRALARNPHHIGYWEDLIVAYLQADQQEPARILLDALLLGIPDHLGFLQDRAQLALKAGRYQAAQVDLRHLLALRQLSFEDQLLVERDLASAYRRSGNFKSALEILENLLEIAPEHPDYWYESVDILFELKRPQEALALLTRYRKRFPDDLLAEQIEVEYHLYQLKDVHALELYRAYLLGTSNVSVAVDVASLLIDAGQDDAAITWLLWARTRVADLRLTQLLSELYVKQQDYAGAALLYEGLVQARPHRVLWVRELASLYLALKRGDEALPLLEQLIHRIPADPEVWFLMGEARSLRGETGAMRAAYLEGLRLARQAGRPEAELVPYALQVAFLDQDWPKVIRLLEGWFQTHTPTWLERRDLAYAYWQVGRWSEAYQEYRQLYHEAGNRDDILSIIRQLAARYDHRITSEFFLGDSGAETLLEWRTRYQGYFHPHFQLDVELTEGFYQNDAINFDNDAQVGKLAVLWDPNAQWDLIGGLSLGRSDAETSIGPFAIFKFRHQDTLTLRVDYQHQELRRDLAQAVAAGTTLRRAGLEWQALWANRLFFSGHYDFERSMTRGGDTAITHEIEPRLDFILWHRPYVTLGYQYTFNDSSGDAAFFAQVPLLPRINAHYLTGFIGHPVLADLYVEAGFFWGHDASRNLDFISADLWGGRALVHWFATPWLDVTASYDYGRENPSSAVLGQNHQFRLSLSGHWY